MSSFETIVRTITERRRSIIILLVLTTVLFGVGIPMIDGETSIDQFEADTTENEKLDYINTNFSTGDNTSTTQIIVRDENVLTKEAYLDQLEYQQELYDNSTINRTLTDDEVVGVANLIGTTAIHHEERDDLENRSDELNSTVGELERSLTALQNDPTIDAEAEFESVQANSSVNLTADHRETFERSVDQLRSAENQSQVEDAYRLGTREILADEFEELEEERQSLSDGIDPTLEEQIEQLESLNESEVDEITEAVLSENGSQTDQGLLFMPTDYDPGTTESNATMMIAVLEGDSASMAPGNAPDEIVDAELAMQSLAQNYGGELSYQIFGDGIITEEIDASMKESLLIVAPFAFLFVLLVLAIAYRDFLDIVLGLFGIVIVLVWTLGFMGWAEISFNQIFIAVPVLLIGLSIDYAIHVFMRHREERTNSNETRGPRHAMRIALGGVGVALIYVTTTTVIGFLSNLASPLDPIREFGIVSAVGILSTFVVFGVLLPALKIELDEWLESRGVGRRKRAFGTGGGRVGQVLSVGKTAAKKAPVAVLVIAVLLSMGGVYGATHVDTSFQTEDFLADEPPAWTDDLPEELAPTNYTAAASMDYLNDHFVRQDSEAEILIEGEITDAETLERVAEAEDVAADQSVTETLSNGDIAISSPLTAMEQTAAENESFNKTFTSADTTDDGIPNENISAVYDHFYEVDSERAESTIYRVDDSYEGLRMTVSVDGGAEGSTVKDQMENIVTTFEEDTYTATATGQVIINSQTEDELLDTVIQSLTVSLIAVFLFLMAVYRRTEGSAMLGAVTILPVAFTVTWILGTMYLLDIPFNIVTGMITSLTIGLGVAYSIHVSERYNQELLRTDSVWEAMDASITGTGGALLGSAATTAGGFAVLIVAFLPFLQQFGLITALMIIYAFLASVLVLPSLLAIWTRFAGPTWTLDDFETTGGDPPLGEITVSESTTDRTAASHQNVDEEAVTSGENTAIASSPTRQIETHHVPPGQPVHVTMTLHEATGRCVLREEIDDGKISVEEVAPEPIRILERNHSLYVIWDIENRDQASVKYRIEVPDTMMNHESIKFHGEIMSTGGTQPIEGDRSVIVVTDLFERVIAKGQVTQDDLAAAAKQFDRGNFTEDQFERIYRSWLTRSAE